MFIFRWLGTLLILFALVAFAMDGTKSLAENEIVLTPLGQHWHDLNAPSLVNAQAAVERYVAPFLWDPVMITILQWPTWAVLGVLGIFLFWIGRRRERRDPFAN